MEEKILFFYCSIVPFDTPPNWLKLNSEEISKKYPLIFIDIPLKVEKFEYNNVFKFFSLYKIFFLTKGLFNIKLYELFPTFNKKFLVKINFFIYYKVLKIGLYFQRFLYGKKIILITTTGEKDWLYYFFPFDKIFFDCTDDFYPRYFEKNKKILTKFDAIFVNTNFLRQKLIKYNRNIHLISAGYYDSLPLFKDGFRIKNSVVFAGGISKRIDFPLLEKIISENSKIAFFFVGEIYLLKYYVDKDDRKFLKKWERILSYRNVVYLGNFEKHKLNKLLTLFEVGIIPYSTLNYFNLNSHPIKIYEYLAAGLKVVTTPISIFFELNKNLPLYLFNYIVEKNTSFENIANQKINSKQKEIISDLIEANIVEKKATQMLKIILTNIKLKKSS